MKHKNQESSQRENAEREIASSNRETKEGANDRETLDDGNERSVTDTSGEGSGQKGVNPDDASSEHPGCLEKITILEAKLQESNDKFLRLFSDFDNYRKRTARERLELTKTATADIIAAILPVVDDLERAVSHPAGENGAESSNEGLILILNKFKSILRQKGVEEIKTIGGYFNTDYHEAVSHIAADKEEAKGKIADEILKGYLLNGKVIRYARVVVAN